MSLVPDYNESDSELSASDNEELNNSTKVSQTQQNPPKLLPVPEFVNGRKEQDRDDLPRFSVFSNPFMEAENAKQTILEKHVKMVSTENVTTINGKKICWNYRKGRCRFGHNCVYAHDSDLQKTKEQLNQESQLQLKQSSIYQQQSQDDSKHSIGKQRQSNLIIGSGMKRKRPGLSQTLVPGKKVLKQYEKLKSP